MVQSIRVIESFEATPVNNIALEEALHLTAEKTETPIIRLWHSDKAVVLGCSRQVKADLYLDNCRADAIPVLRRHSGGGTVYIHPDVLNFTVIVPYFHPDLAPRLHIRESQQFFLKPVIGALKRMGITADISSRGDLTIDGRKVGGNAQARKKLTLLHHGTLMIEDRVGEMDRYLRVPPERRGIPHTEFVTGLRHGGYEFDETGFRGEFAAEWTRITGCGEIIYGPPHDEELELVEKLIERKYSLEAYNLRR